MSTTSLSLQWRGGNSDGLQAAPPHPISVPLLTVLSHAGGNRRCAEQRGRPEAPERAQTRQGSGWATPVAQAGNRSPSREGAGKSQKLSSQGPVSVVT